MNEVHIFSYFDIEGCCDICSCAQNITLLPGSIPKYPTENFPSDNGVCKLLQGTNQYLKTLKPFKVELITRYTCVPHRLPEQSSQGTDPYLIGVNLLITYLYMFLVVFNILIHNH
uniref:Uncharacterized protein n=1 Tax=Cacopsylla melanoneura TaxID=428564 RepID=A0A8D8M2D2_9HEMI